MREQDAQNVLMARAFEETDPEGHLLNMHERASATRSALARAGVTGDGNAEPVAEALESIDASATIRRRAELLVDTLARHVPALRGVMRFSRVSTGWAPVVIAAALISGFMTNALGPDRHINLLSFPLFFLLGWNLLRYAWMLVTGLWRLAARRSPGEPVEGGGGARRLAGVFLRGALWRGWHGWLSLRKPPDATATTTRITAQSFARYGALWFRHAGLLLTARVRRTLHVAAVVMIAGAVGGMYLRGFAFEYRATWESTLLGADHVQWLLGAVLGPAAALLGVRLPDVAPLRGPGGDGDAAIWIHLYAVTALLVVAVPRILLALYEWWRCRRLSANVFVDLEDGYFRQLLADWRGGKKRVQILPYSFHPKAGTVDMLKSLLHDFFGVRADIRVEEALSYGDEADAVTVRAGDGKGGDGSGGGDGGRGDEGTAAGSSPPDTCHVVLFNLAQSPEIEVHGSFLEELKARLDPEHEQMLVIIDVSSYEQRVQAPDRWEQRLRAWDRVTREAGMVAVDLTPDRPEWDESLAAVRAALWPSDEAVAGSVSGAS